MAGGRGLDDLRVELRRIYAQMDDAIEAGQDTTALENRANVLQDEIGAIAEVLGTEVREQIRARPRPDPPAGTDRLF